MCFHLIFSTKDRYPFLKNEEIRSELFSYMVGVLKQLNSVPIQVGGVSDHVHVLATLPRTMSTSKLVQELKRVTSMWLKEKGVEKFAWQAGYGVFSVSQSNIDSVDEYIRNQEEHHRVRSFKEEYLSFLRKHAIEYDERYMWD